MVSRALLDEWINGNLKGHTEAEYIQLIRYFQCAADIDYLTAETMIED